MNAEKILTLATYWAKVKGVKTKLCNKHRVVVKSDVRLRADYSVKIQALRHKVGERGEGKGGRNEGNGRGRLLDDNLFAHWV